MGQAQLLLIVLGVVLVGIAIIAGIQAYDQNNRKSSVDALTHDAIRMASDLQTWAQKPVQFGGPDPYGDFADATYAKLGYNTDGANGGNLNTNGECVAAFAASTTFTCTNASLGTQAVITVDGLSSADIVVTSTALSGAGGTP